MGGFTYYVIIDIQVIDMFAFGLVMSNALKVSEQAHLQLCKKKLTTFTHFDVVSFAYN